MKKLPAITIALAAALASAASQPQDLTAKVDAYMNAGVEAGQYSSAVLIARRGQVLVSKGFGMANYEHDVPIGVDTKFRIASVTKMFTATAILMLQERGRLNVTDAACKYLAPCPASWTAVTIHHLLSHSSGIPDVTRLPNFETMRTAPIAPAELVARIAEMPLSFRPGEKFMYSNSGYLLLGTIIERVTGELYSQFLQKNIFDAVGMAATGYDDPSVVLKRRATGYERRADRLANAPYVSMTIPFAAGGLYSTAEDLYNWSQAFFSGQLVSEKTLASMTTPYKGPYGYGLQLREEFGNPTVGHGGSIEGFTSYLVRYPREDVTIVVLSNMSNSPSAMIGRDLAAIVFDQRYEVPTARKEIAINPAILDDYVGEYERAPGRNLIITRRNSKLFMDFINRPTVELGAESETEFFVKGPINVRITFVREGQHVTHLILHQLGESIPVRKVK